MTVNVRVFGYSGIAALPISQGAGQDHKDSIFVTTQPYDWCQYLSAVSASAVSAAFATATRKNPAGRADTTNFIRVEVQDSGTVRYEITPVGTVISADVNSPAISGMNQLQFGVGWSISFIDAATVGGGG